MADKIQFRRGDKINLPILDAGEPALTEDTKEVWVGTPTGNTQVGGNHALGDPLHNADTLANLNLKISDAALIDTGDPRLSDDRTSDGIRTASSVVSVGAAVAPSADQVLKATGPSSAVWDVVHGYDVPLSQIAGSSFGTVQDAQNLVHSAGEVASSLADLGGGILRVGAGNGFLRAINDSTATLSFFDWPQIDIPIALDTIRYIGVEYNAGTARAVSRVTDSWDYNTEFPLGLVVNEGNSIHVRKYPHLAHDAHSQAIQRLDQTMGSRRDDKQGGLHMGETGVRNITLSEGAIWHRLSRIPILGVDTSLADSIDSYYRDGIGGMLEVPGVTQWDNAQYDDGSGTLAPMTAGYWTNLWFYLGVGGKLLSIYGTAEYASQAACELEGSPVLKPLHAINGILIGRFVVQQGSATVALIQSAFEEALGFTGVTAHSQLSGLAVGNDHPQYLLATAAAGGALSGNYPNPTVNGLTAGVLSADVNHGVRGGGSQHTVATQVSAGFLSVADKTKLDSILANAVLAAEVF